MAGQLEQDHQRQLETWIGTGPKSFNLLYSVAQNGRYDAATFHEMCDDQGPTVTVLYNTEGSVFGGYTSQSWRPIDRPGASKTDRDAFLFGLKHCRVNRYNILRTLLPWNAIYCRRDHGPEFGMGPDLLTFSGEGDKVNDLYELDGYMNPSRSYNWGNFTQNDFNNGNRDRMRVYDLEVYQVMDVQNASGDPERDEIREPVGEVSLSSSPTEQGLEGREQSSEQFQQILENSKADEEDLNIPVEILKMDEKSQQRYKKALQVGKVKVNNIRVMVVGSYGAGKTTLTRRLLDQQVDISERNPTEGIDIHKHCCKVSVDTREWTVQHEGVEILAQLQPLLLPEVIGEQEGHNKVIDEGETSHDNESPIDQNMDRISPQPPQSSSNKADESHSACDESVADNQESGIPASSNGNVVMMNLVQSFNDRVAGKPMKNIQEATVGMWDFAGEEAFYTTHQTFLTWRAIYLLVADISKENLASMTDDTEGGLLCRSQVEGWLNSIHCCEPQSTAVGNTMRSIATGTLVTSPSPATSMTPSSTGISVTLPTVGTPVTPSSAYTPARSPSAGAPMTSASTVTSGTSPSADITMTSPSLSNTQMIPAAGTRMTSSAADITMTSPTPESAVTLSVSITPEISDDVISATPPVILVGTHVDKIPEGERKEHISKYRQKIHNSFKEKPTLQHLVDFIAIDNTKIDPQLKILQNKIVQLAAEQPYWGEEVPTSYILMEEEFRKLRAHDKKVILLNELGNIDRALPVPIQKEDPTNDLDVFLRFQHDIGNIVYFSAEGLRENIVLDPQWLVDAQKSLITTDTFIRGKYPDKDGKWLELIQQGKLTHELIDAVWTKENNPEFHNNKDLILKLLEKLNIIAHPRSFTIDGEKVEEDFFLVPCMLHQESPKEIISPGEDSRLVHTSVLCLYFTGKFLPTPIFHRLVAACVAKWKVAKKTETSDYLIFSSCCMFNLDLFHRLSLYCRSHAICARITRMVTDDIRIPDTKWCTRVRKFINLQLKKIISYLHQNIPLELRIQCPTCCGVSEDGMVSFSSFQMWLADEGDDSDATLTREHMNYGRMCIALSSVCAEALREILHNRVKQSYVNVSKAILGNRQGLEKQMNSYQKQLVFPDPQGKNIGKLEDFDISLLYILIKTVTSVAKPKSGWKCLPNDNPRDTSLGASVERMHLIRNDFYTFHSPSGRINESNFKAIWDNLDKVIQDIETELGKKVWRRKLQIQWNHVITIYEACGL